MRRCTRPRAAAHRSGAQELALYPTATARENLLVFAGLYGLRRRAAHRRIEALADSLVLGDVLDRSVRDLSGGQQRRLQAATAMIHRPNVLLLDEPTVGADPITRDALLGVVRAAAADGAGVVYTTHYLPELDVLGATLAVADGGRIVARGDRSTLLAGVSGHAVIEFDTPASDLSIPAIAAGTIHLDGGRVTIRAPDPGGTLAPWLAAHPAASRHLRSIEIHPPTLDDLYRQLVRS
jgi:ABC-2 type transport system ATP-binding protein